MQSTKQKIYLFTDASVNPQSGIGVGAYLVLNESEFSSSTPRTPRQLEKRIQTKRFENTSSTKLELETLLWALDDVDLVNYALIIYTDCQNIIGLQDRREGFERKNYLNSKHKQIKNHQLYKDFYKKIDSLDCEFVKVKGHKKSSLKDEIDEIFSLVDRASRETLRRSL